MGKNQNINPEIKENEAEEDKIKSLNDGIQPDIPDNEEQTKEVTPEEKILELEDKMAKRPEMARVYKTYAARCFKAGAMDFDDSRMIERSEHRGFL